MTDPESRPLTVGERRLAQTVFGNAIAYDRVRIVNRKWAFFQPRRTTMAPMGHIHFHPRGGVFRPDFADSPLSLQGHFLHEMTHVWQAQQQGRWYLPFMRHPFCRYAYTLKPGWPLQRYGLEQQAEIVRHYFLLSKGEVVAGAPGLAAYRAILPFEPLVKSLAIK